MPKPKCLYYGPRWDHRLAPAASVIIPTYFDYRDWDSGDLNFKPDVVISFLSDRILKGDILNLPNINFHPAPPKYPGRGGASYALYNADEYYGATAHQMIERVDAGKVYWVSSFPIRANDTCETLFEKAEDKCLELLLMFCSFYKEHNCMPNGHINQWSGPAKTKKDFQEFLNINSVDVEDYFMSPAIAQAKKLLEIRRKIKACKHSKFPGPYLNLDGYKFELCKDQS